MQIVTTSPNQSGPGSNSNEDILHTPKISETTASTSEAVQYHTEVTHWAGGVPLFRAQGQLILTTTDRAMEEERGGVKCENDNEKQGSPIYDLCTGIVYFHVHQKIIRNWPKTDCLVGFYGISTFVGYLMPNPFYGWLVGFYGISTFVGYLTPNPFLCKQSSLV